MGNQRDKFFNESVEEAFYKLSPKEQEQIDEMVQVLTKKFKNMGVLSAMELLSKIGIAEHKKETELVKLLDIVERKTSGDGRWRRKQYIYSRRKTE